MLWIFPEMGTRFLFLNHKLQLASTEEYRCPPWKLKIASAGIMDTISAPGARAAGARWRNLPQHRTRDRSGTASGGEISKRAASQRGRRLT